MAALCSGRIVPGARSFAKLLVLTGQEETMARHIGNTNSAPYELRVGCSFPLHGVGGEATWRRVPQTKKDPSCSRVQVESRDEYN